VKSVQLSLFPEEESQTLAKEKQKQCRLGRYERIQRELEQNDPDPYKISVEIDSPPDQGCHYNFVDLFCGAGGMTQGLFQAGFKPVASVENHPIASATYRKNFPQCHHFSEDIQTFKPMDWLKQIDSPLVHLLVGGPPCQGFSVAGKRNPNDPRNYLFQEFLRIASEISPWYIVMENVPGILTMKKGKVKEAILDAFDSIGYSTVSVLILESAAYGVPQIRQYLSIESAISDLPEYTRIPEINHEWTNHSPEYMERLAKVPPGGSLYQSYADAFKRQYPGKPSMTIKENHGGTHIHPHLNRVISAREMARLQTFPDSFIFEGSMKKAMWQVGNAVPPRLAECIGYALIPFLNKIVLCSMTSVYL